MKVLWEEVVSTFREVITLTVAYGWALTTLIVALSGPFGMFETHPFLFRLAYWGVVIGLAIPLGVCCRMFWRKIRSNTPPLIEDILVVGTMSLILGQLVVGLSNWLGPDEPVLVVGWPLVTLITFLVAGGIVYLRRLTSPVQDPPAEYRRDRLLDRVNAPVGVRLVRVSSDNHHIRVLTSDGAETRLLMRLRDAIAEIDIEQGLTVHRSHWLALHAIDQVVTEDGKEAIRMTGGDVVPIGPKFRANLIETGLLAA